VPGTAARGGLLFRSGPCPRFGANWRHRDGRIAYQRFELFPSFKLSSKRRDTQTVLTSLVGDEPLPRLVSCSSRLHPNPINQTL
jgi:hypothetical protein